MIGNKVASAHIVKEVLHPAAEPRRFTSCPHTPRFEIGAEILDSKLQSAVGADGKLYNLTAHWWISNYDDPLADSYELTYVVDVDHVFCAGHRFRNREALLSAVADMPLPDQAAFNNSIDALAPACMGGVGNWFGAFNALP
jgi:hypothetical protein